MRPISLIGSLFLLSLAPPMWGQAVDASHIGDSVDLSGTWRYHLGDDPRWADRDLDDSGWPVISTLKSWGQQGLGGYSGMLWYRLQVHLPDDYDSLSLLLRNAKTSYQVYADGQLIGDFGGMPPHPVAFGPAVRFFRLPPALPPRPSDLTIAVRFWHWRDWAENLDGGIQEGPRSVLLGPSGAIEGAAALQHATDLFGRFPALALAGMNLLIGLALLFYYLRAKNAEALWLALYCLAGMGLIPNLLLNSGGRPVQALDFMVQLLRAAGLIFLIQWILATLRINSVHTARGYQLALAAIPVSNSAFHRGLISLHASHLISASLDSLLAFAPLALLIGVFRKYPRTLMVLWPVLLASADTILNGVGWFSSEFHLRARLVTPGIHFGPFFISLGILMGLLFLPISLAIVFERPFRAIAKQGQVSVKAEPAQMHRHGNQTTMGLTLPSGRTRIFVFLGSMAMIAALFGFSLALSSANSNARRLQRQISIIDLQRRIVVINDLLRENSLREAALKEDARKTLDRAVRTSLSDQLDDIRLENDHISRQRNDAEARLNFLSDGRTRVNSVDGLLYVFIPPGDFTMGCSKGDRECYHDEKPAHKMRLARAFWIGQTEVTQAAWKKVTGSDNPSYFRSDQLPVEQVTWYDAAEYCRKIGGRLPEDNEWEYAARAGTTGPEYEDLDKVAWVIGNSDYTTHPGALKEPNAFGLYDVLGNVWEWVADSHDNGGASKVIRGGSWYSIPPQDRVSVRNPLHPSDSLNDVGFRCISEFID